MNFKKWYCFFLRFLVDIYDRDSGIYKIKWELIVNNSNMVFRSGEILGNKINVSFKICIKIDEW